MAWDEVSELLGRFPEGASLEEVLVGLDPKTTRRTLQRRLSKLVGIHRVEAVGQGRARRYKLAHGARVGGEAGAPFPLSRKAEEVLQKVTQPLAEREVARYRREFLDAYEPNRTWYLPEEVRRELWNKGKTDGERPSGTYAREMYSRLLIDLSWNSSRLEGNTYSLLETERLLEWGEAAKGKDQRETQMILNHKAALEFLLGPGMEVNRYVVLNLHALLADELLPDEACGSLRQIGVAIGGSTYVPLAVPQLIAECFEEVIEKVERIEDPFEQAFFLMVHLSYLQPFEDVNKRVSRLVANVPLMRGNVCPLTFVDVPESIYISGLLGVYELNRVELLQEVFVWAYERSCLRYVKTRQVLGEPDPFRIRYRALRKETVALVVRGEMSQLAAIILIRERAREKVAEEDRTRFVEVVETELMSLHEGNSARYGVTGEEFERWKTGWNR